MQALAVELVCDDVLSENCVFANNGGMRLLPKLPELTLSCLACASAENPIRTASVCVVDGEAAEAV